MKYRQGFDSNCSSMSFVVSKDEFETMKDLAKAMIDFMFKTEQEDYPDLYPEKERKEYLKALEEAPDGEGLMFASCNYDTFIYEGDVKYFVSTCNNHDMWSFLEGKMNMMPDFTIKESFYNIHNKESKVETIHGNSEWF